jgi:tetratricopeptide (TPR) repeat protein
MVFDEYGGVIMGSTRNLSENFKKAEDSFFAEDYIGAIFCLEKIIDENPGMFSAYNLRAMANGRLGNYDEALADLERVLTIDPDDEFAYDIVHSDEGFKDKLLGAIRSQENFSKAVKCLNSDDYVGAIVYLEKIIDEFPEALDAYNLRATANGGLENYGEALADFERVLAIDPDNEYAYNTKDKLLKTLPPDWVVGESNNPVQSQGSQKVVDYFDTGDYAGAIVYLEELIEENPKDVFAYNNRGLANIRLGNYDEALADFERVFAIDPDNEYAHDTKDELLKAVRVESNFDKAFSCLESHNYQLAIAYFDEVLKDVPNDWKIYASRSTCFQSLGDYYEAIRDVERALAIDPDNLQLGSNRAFLITNYPVVVDALTIQPRTDFGPSNRYPLETFNEEGISSVDWQVNQLNPFSPNI